jgi:ribosomal protein S18 acetylase RimI-like enzyme
MTIAVRLALPEEHDETGRVTAGAYREFVGPEEDDWHDYLDHIANVAKRARFGEVYVAVEDGRILGSATLELDERIDPHEDPPLRPHESHIRMLGVSPEARGRGVARALMTACEERARASGRTLMTLNTTQRMETAQRMYEALGYVRGEDRILPDGFVLLSYSKDLGPA